jgi:NIMA (never in mitosis gene a)-related kinase 1/4/5
MKRIGKFTVLEKVGEGSFSNVYRVSKEGEDTIYALKRVKIMKLKDKDKENTLNEIRLLASLRDKNVITYKEAFIDEESTCLW